MIKRKVLTGLAALTLFDIAAAHAQSPPVFNWAGSYIGVNAGYRWATLGDTTGVGGLPVFDPVTSMPSFPLLITQRSHRQNNGLYGFQTGYNSQVSPNFLLGLEADFDWGRGHGLTTFSLFDPVSGSAGSYSIASTIDWTATLRGRAGFVSGPWLFYATGGFALQRMNLTGIGGFNGAAANSITTTTTTTTTTTICTAFLDGACVATTTINTPVTTSTTSVFNSRTNSATAFSSEKTMLGLVIGAGLEYQLANNWLLRLEYLFADYGHVGFGSYPINNSYVDNGVICVCTVNSMSVGGVSSTVTTQTLRVGLSFMLP